MSNTKSNLGKLVVFENQHMPASQNEPPRNFARDMLRHPDSKLAAQLIADHAGLVFDQQHGGDIVCLNFDLKELNERYKKSEDQINEKEDKVKNTPQFIKCAQSDSATKMTFNDKCLVCFMLLGSLVCMVMGAANVYANLIASGEPVFLENPWIAVSLSMLVPMASLALKFISNFYEYASTKKSYALFIYGLSALLIVLWTVLFSLNFSGASGGVDWDSLGSDNSDASALVWVQLFCEILISVALFLAIDDVLLKYSPTAFTENVAHLNTKKSYESHCADHEKLRISRNEILLKLTSLEKEREKSVLESVAAFHAVRARRQSEINS